MMDVEQQRYSNMMGQDTLGRNMMIQDNMGRNMMGRNIYNIVSNRGMPSDVSNMMGQQMMTPNTMYSNVMGQPMGQHDEERDGDILIMTNNRMTSNMMGQDSNSQMMGHNMLGQQDMTPKTMYSNMMG